jgi:ribose/xylose/arabinose/galactoside ABC-type transport system permease subunit
MTVNLISLSIGIIFAPIAALMAYLITYGEYQHHYSDNKKPRKLAMEAALGTLLLFLFISLVIGWFLGGIVK